MNFLIALFTGDRSRLSPKKVKHDLYSVATLVLFLGLIGTLSTAPAEMTASQERVASVIAVEPRIEPAMKVVPPVIVPASAKLALDQPLSLTSTPAPPPPKPKPKPKPKAKVKTTAGGNLSGDNSVKSLQAFAGSKLGSAAQLKCLVKLWNRESGWNYKADNPSSSAYGIPQSLPGSKMSSAGADWATNPRTQIKWGLGYISDRYGTPCAALSHSDARNWY